MPIRHLAAALILALSSTVALASSVYTTAETDIGTLIDDPAARAVLEKHIPGFTSRDQIDLARPMTMRGIQSYIPDELTDSLLNSIDADLATLPAKK